MKNKLSLLLFKLIFFSFLNIYGQKPNVNCSKFEPIFFSENSSLIDTIFFERLDSIGRFLETDTNFVLQFKQFIYGFEGDSIIERIKNERFQNVENYLMYRFNVKIDEYNITQYDSGGPVQQKGPEEFLKIRKLYFTIKNCPN